MAEGCSKDFELYVTSTGTVQVSSDVKLKILHELQESDLSLSEISKLVSKAQSTVSVHLDNMVQDGLIAVHDDLQDNRKKYYSLISLPFGKSVPSSEQSKEIAFNLVSKVAQDPERMLKSMARFVILGFGVMGLNVDPTASILGFFHGAAMSGSMTGQTLEETIDNARNYFRELGLGEVSIYSTSPLTIIVKDNTPLTEEAANTMIRYFAGFFSKILEDANGKTYEMVSSEVFGSDFNYIRFVLEPKLNKASTQEGCDCTE